MPVFLLTLLPEFFNWYRKDFLLPTAPWMAASCSSHKLQSERQTLSWEGEAEGEPQNFSPGSAV
jgi:hypothetical protein